MTEARPRRPLQPHGTTARAYGRPDSGVPPCGCEPCLDAGRAYNTRRQALRQLGQPGRLPAKTAAAHVRRLLAAGMSWQDVLDATGVSRGAMANLLKDGARITITTHMRILAVPRPAARKPSLQHVDATGTRRRLQALLRIGWSCEELGPLLGVSASRMAQLMKAEQVTLATRARVIAVYRRLEDTQGPSSRNVRRAERAGWPRPVDWDGMDIDDPTVAPDAVKRAPRPLVVAEETEFLTGMGVARHVIAEQLGLNVESLERTLARARVMSEAGAR